MPFSEPEPEVAAGIRAPRRQHGEHEHHQPAEPVGEQGRAQQPAADVGAELGARFRSSRLGGRVHGPSVARGRAGGSAQAGTAALEAGLERLEPRHQALGAAAGRRQDAELARHVDASRSR